ncbi:MAG: SDR family NAD(P)-dependent oxidoreductase [Halanaerobiaceae bacterium]
MQLKGYVTGADRGLGLALTETLLKNDYIVYAGRYMEDWKELDELKEEYGDWLNIIPLDVSSKKSVEEAASKIKSATSSLDLLINNAGIYQDRSGNIFEDLYYDDMIKMYEVNTLGPLKVTRSVVDLLVEGRQKMLVNISSEAGSVGDCWRKEEFGYCMSKAALNKQSAILQNHLGDYGIKVLAIHPGYLKSYMSGEKNYDADIEPEESAENIFKLLNSKTEIDAPMYYDYLGNQFPW